MRKTVRVLAFIAASVMIVIIGFILGHAVTKEKYKARPETTKHFTIIQDGRYYHTDKFTDFGGNCIIVMDIPEEPLICGCFTITRNE